MLADYGISLAVTEHPDVEIPLTLGSRVDREIAGGKIITKNVVLLRSINYAARSSIFLVAPLPATRVPMSDHKEAFRVSREHQHAAPSAALSILEPPVHYPLHIASCAVVWRNKCGGWLGCGSIVIERLYAR